MIARRQFLISGLALSGSLALPSLALATTLPRIAMQKDPWCGCCTGWAGHLEGAGFPVDIAEVEDMDAVKTRLQVPGHLWSCHTAMVEGYVIEGHVPAQAILALIAEKPAITGLAVPGMPMGSPGMDVPAGSPVETYDVVAFGGAAEQSFMRFSGPNRV